jgi:hypothetical protein
MIRIDQARLPQVELLQMTLAQACAMLWNIFFVRRENPGGDYYGARSGDYKLVQNAPDRPFMLYNLRDDLAESTDLSASEPARFLQLTSALDQHRRLPNKFPGNETMTIIHS